MYKANVKRILTEKHGEDVKAVGVELADGRVYRWVCMGQGLALPASHRCVAGVERVSLIILNPGLWVPF